MEKKNSSFEDMVCSSTKRLMNYALTFYPNKMDAEDLTQETIFRMLSRKEQFDGTNFKAWSCVVMKSIFLCQRKSEAIRRTEDIENCYNVNSTSMTDSDVMIKSVLQYLSEPHRKVMQMIVDGYRYHEIADILDIPIGTVKSRINTARKRIESIDGKIKF